MLTTLYMKETKGARASGLMLSTKIVGFSGSFGKGSLRIAFSIGKKMMPNYVISPKYYLNHRLAAERTTL